MFYNSKLEIEVKIYRAVNMFIGIGLWGESKNFLSIILHINTRLISTFYFEAKQGIYIQKIILCSSIESKKRVIVTLTS